MKKVRLFFKALMNVRVTLRVAFFLAFRQIRRSSKWTTGLIIFIMMLTFLNLVVVSGLLVGLISGSYVQFRDHYAGDVLITPAPGRTYIEDSQDIVSYVKGLPEVETVSSRTSILAQVKGTLDENPKAKEKPNVSGGAIIGINPDEEEKLSEFSKFVLEGQNLKNGEEGFILIGANLIKEYSTFGDVDIPGLELLKNIKVGDRVRVSIETEAGPAEKDVIVKGIMKSKVDQISQRYFMVDKELRRMLPANRLELQEIAIKSKPDMGRLVADDVMAHFNNPRVRVQTYQEAIPSFLRDIETTFGILGNFLSSFGLILACITVFIVVFINAVNRRKYIGILKGIGVEPRVITLAYVCQAVFYGVAGATIGLVITFGLLKPFFERNPINFPFSDGILVATLDGSLLRVGILLFVTILAGFIPAYMIVRKNTLDSILGR
ncbi:MAG TPA: FtsX-like permease family protein [Patescibacteria group bacterium]|nr:FtsX-like permease family protein [Patescibacteria group bacterium]